MKKSKKEMLKEINEDFAKNTQQLLNKGVSLFSNLTRINTYFVTWINQLKSVMIGSLFSK